MCIIRKGTLADYAVVLDRIRTSFCQRTPNHLAFDFIYPDSVNHSEACMSQWLLAEIDGEIAAGMQIVPRPMVVANINLPAAGLGNVFCYPPFRGQGLMTSLLQAAIAEMEKAGQTICILGGDRMRYGRLGWEHAGTTRRLGLSANMTRHLQEEKVSVMDFRCWQGDASDTKSMFEAYNALPYRTRRTEKEFELVFKRPGQVVWLSDTPECGFAYASLRGGAIVEYAGATEALERLLKFLLQASALDISIPPPLAETKREEMFLSHAQSFSVIPSGMIRLISLEKTLHCFQKILVQRLDGWRGSFALEVKETGERVTFKGGENGLEFIGAPSVTPILLGLQDMVRLLFGPFAPALPETVSDNEFLRRAFPLPLYLNDLSHV